MPALLRGQLLQARFEYVRACHGAGVVERVLQALPPEERDRLRGVRGDEWYPFSTLVRLDRAIAATVAPGDDKRIFVEMGRASARNRTEWLGEHAALVSVHGFLSRMAEEHRRFHTYGRAEYRRLGFRSGQISFFEYEEKDPVYCLSGLGYITAAVELLSGGPARVEEQTCQCDGQPACCYDVRWDDAPVR